MAATASAVGTGLSAFGQVREGQYARAAGEYNRKTAYAEAEGLDIEAGQKEAEGTHAQALIQKRAEEIIAETIAKGASGGQSADDATVQAHVAETVERKSLSQLVAQAEADEAAQQLRHGAEIKRRGGDWARTSGRFRQGQANIGAASTLLQGGSSWYKDYGGDVFGG